jgi:hypothetical protein
MRRFTFKSVAALALLAAATLPTTAQTLPPQGWAHTTSLVQLQPNGVPIESESVLNRLLIQETFSRWGIAWDEARLDVVRTLFTPDAVYEVTKGSDKRIAKEEGIDRIVAAVSNALKQQADQRRHAMTNVVIERMSKDQATALGYGIVTVAANGLSLAASVMYRAELRLGSDGVWRFSKFLIAMDEYAGRTITPPTK